MFKVVTKNIDSELLYFKICIIILVDSGKSLLAALSEKSLLLMKNSNIDNISAFGGKN